MTSWQIESIYIVSTGQSQGETTVTIYSEALAYGNYKATQNQRAMENRLGGREAYLAAKAEYTRFINESCREASKVLNNTRISKAKRQRAISDHHDRISRKHNEIYKK